ncbi:uncharacterized protein A1O9_02871 [Exophiala aquamarina CBS 119918]|uniref:Palmitoyltransferase n=1 Tax=Exophiala aquamarina CBS 119918 TaxID=1182545 RepID=A0A072PN73_9EURO|nr:uncharacterized protein A1O9_02871 [Exophiala aquamarina CBS 119918]KEF61306.1 hypothetical protein A1O9_02871 [Exophiala aquamarina CBS 119918]
MKLIQPVKPMSKQRGNIITARIVPLFLLGLLGYSSYVITKHVCIDYLIRPRLSLPTLLHPDIGAAIAILTIYYLLLLMTLTCFGRLIETILTNPGLVPRGPQYFVEKETARQKESHSHNKDEGFEYDSTTRYSPQDPSRPHSDESIIRPEDFWHKDAFVCGWDGRPPFCSTCYNYKPDRAHHCSELGRCVIKMDHFCPWVGGIVSETSFKYFIQFTGWAAVLCLSSLIYLAYYFAKRRREEDFVNVHWILVLIFAALFGLFNAGMCGSSLQFALINSTTIENFTRKTKVWYLAVHMPRAVLDRYNGSGRTDLRLISYPRPSAEQFELLQRNGAKLNDSQQSIVRDGWDSQYLTAPTDTYDPQSTSTFPPHPTVPRKTPPPSRGNASVSPPQSAPHTLTQNELRTFAILETDPGANPFDLGSFGNFKQVMGNNLFDWLIPLRPSPLTDHTDPTSFYKLGSVLDRLKRDAGIARVDVDHNEKRSERHRRHRRKSRRTSTGSRHRRDADH